MGERPAFRVPRQQDLVSAPAEDAEAAFCKAVALRAQRAPRRAFPLPGGCVCAGADAARNACVRREPFGERHGKHRFRIPYVRPAPQGLFAALRARADGHCYAEKTAVLREGLAAQQRRGAPPRCGALQRGAARFHGGGEQRLLAAGEKNVRKLCVAAFKPPCAAALPRSRGQRGARREDGDPLPLPLPFRRGRIVWLRMRPDLHAVPSHKRCMRQFMRPPARRCAAEKIGARTLLFSLRLLN